MLHLRHAVYTDRGAGRRVIVGKAALHEKQELPQTILDKARKLGYELAR